MQHKQEDDSLETLQQIRSIMDRSARFLSLSGWSGIWAGCTALIGAAAAYYWLPMDLLRSNYMVGEAEYTGVPYCFCGGGFIKPLLLAIAIFAVALAGGFYFTWRKVRHQQSRLWTAASRQMLWAIAIPLIAGGIFAIGFMSYGDGRYIAPACLAFYGLALLNGSKYTLSEIRYLGMLEIALGCISIFLPGMGLVIWAIGFGVLHIFYGIIMWYKYDKHTA